MGGGSSHLAHYPNNALKRADCGNLGGAACGLCGKQVDHGEMAYRCTADKCTSSFILHDACYRYPARIKNHFSGHSLALTARSEVSCTVCAKPLDGFSYVYSCSQSRHNGCGGFGAHPRCGNLPRQASDHSHGHQLVLRETGAGGRRCVKCKQHAGAGVCQVRAWSYQCPTCKDVEFRLPCVLGIDEPPQCCCCVCGAGCAVICAGPAGFAMGHFLHDLFRGCTGLSLKSAIDTARPRA